MRDRGVEERYSSLLMELKKKKDSKKIALSHVQLLHPMNYSPPGFSVPGFLQARILERVAISFSKGSS